MDKASQEDRRRVNTAHAFEVDGLAKRYGTTAQQVRDTVFRVGVLRRKVEAELQRNRKTSTS